MILAGDIGGTKVHLALFRREGEALAKVDEELLPTDGIRSLAEAIERFASRSESVEACGLGVAGPVTGSFVHGANLPWDIDGEQIAHRVGAPVLLRNDLVASAHGLEDVSEEDLVTLRKGAPVEGANRALVSPGTGLGETVLIRAGDSWHAVASEGGHADFSPRTDEELELLRWLRGSFGRVSVERVVSGPGLVNVFCFLRDTEREVDDAGIAARPGDSGSAALIGRNAIEGGSRLCQEALRIWTGALAAEAGNVALRGLALGGVWLGGGIPARVLPALRAAEFLETFEDKEPHRDLLRAVPVRVVLDPETTLKGAARLAAAAR